MALLGRAPASSQRNQNMVISRKQLILVIEDDQFLRQSVRHFLELNGFSVVEASDHGEFVDAIAKCQPDLVLCDYFLGATRGLDILKQLRGNPVTSSIPFIMITCIDDRKVVRTCMEQGCDDFIVKPITSDELIKAVLVRLRPRGVLSPDRLNTSAEVSGPMVSKDSKNLPRLSPRECHVLRTLAEGHSNEEIATSLGISASTVKRHIINIFTKMNCKSRVSAVASYYVDFRLREYVNRRISEGIEDAGSEN